MTSDAFEKEYKRLNKAQKEAVDAIEGPVMVIAGPGSGKTQILSLRVANILLKTDARPSNILCLTFTDSAAVNMRKRLSEMIGVEAFRVSIYTFHSFGTDLIERYPEHFWSGATFAPADELSQIEVLEGILKALPYDNPLRKEHPEQGFTYLYDIRTSIGSLKKAGITPEEFKKALAHIRKDADGADKILTPLFDARLSMKIIPELRAASGKVRDKKTVKFPLPHFASFAESLAASLDSALDDAEEMGKTEPLSRWKSAHFTADTESEEGNKVLKDLANMPKLEALADIYEKYRAHMYKEGHFDFDDMILEVIQRAETDGGFRAELQEQYQYILVDEFQDTNDAQMRLLRALVDAEVSEGRPNIMVVGDDDQAIYKFQGAELNNILNFKSAYRDPKVVTMTHNYRSTQVILDIAKLVIERGEERLENIIPEIQKDLVAANSEIIKGDIVSKTLPTIGHEYRYVAKEIRRLLDAGEQAKNIAVISRKHALLEGLVPYLNDAGVPIRYERQSDVLKEPHVRELIVMARFATSLMKKDMEEADFLLPEILSFPFWHIPRKEIWKVSVKADETRKRWLETMLESESRQIRSVADFFIELSQVALYETVERVIDLLIGSHLALAADTEYDDESEVIDILNPGQASKSSLISPFKEYYFSADKLKDKKAEYIIFLSSLRTFVSAVREYKRGELAKLEDLVAFVDLHEKNNIVIPDTSPFANAFDAVSLVTAHKAKGLEWKTVFVINCRNDVWAGRGPGRKISFPTNLPITPAGDNIDDQLRLFYVALTRAKCNLYLTASATTESGKEALRLQFLFPSDASKADPELAKLLEFQSEPAAIEETLETLTVATNSFSRNPLLYDEQAFLTTLVEDYFMSVTHMNNFLNVGKGGPAFFLEQNLIRFPQESNLSSKFGTAMHALIERIYRHARFEGGLPDTELVLEWLEHELRRFRMTAQDLEQLKGRGEKSIVAFLKNKGESIKPTDKIEVNFKNQGVVIGGAQLTGKIDKMAEIGDGVWSVHDFKTGRAQSDWAGKDDYEKTKLHQYKYQLIFYKLLVENSREFCEKCKVNEGCLEFIEPIGGRIVELGLIMEEKDVERVKKLVEIVYKKITTLDFPDTSGYDKDLSGILAFEEDMIGGKI